MDRRPPLVAILACCGVKIILLAAVLALSGFVSWNVWIGALGLALASVFVIVAVRRRRRCQAACHVPSSRAGDVVQSRTRS
jgi:LPXTG-motif cell wall-anchored protein